MDAAAGTRGRAVRALLFGLQGVPMLLAHITAGAVSGSWLYAVDRLARGLVSLLHAVVGSALPAVVGGGTALISRAVRRAPRRTQRAPAYLCDWATGGCGLRGPPVGASC